MMIQPWTFYLLAVAAQATASTIETSSWWIKGLCGPGQLGLYTSRSNIYLYFGRFFTLAFSAMIAVRIEHGDKASMIVTSLCVGFTLSALMNVALLRGTAVTWRLMHLLRLTLMLPVPVTIMATHKRGVVRPLLLSATLTTLAGAIGSSLPLILALVFPQYRLSLSYSGQLVSSIGTLASLFFVDQRLFRAMDRQVLADELPSYTLGRATGFLLTAACCYGLRLLS